MVAPDYRLIVDSRRMIEAPRKVRVPARRRRRSIVAADRAREAHALLADCRLCAHDCGVNRLAGEKGKCRAGAEARYFSAQTEVGDEPEFVPTFAVALSGCDLRCDFCITGAQSWNARAGQPFQAAEIAQEARAALAAGARSVMILGGEPTIHLPAALELISRLPDDARIIWKTNAHGTAQARQYLAGMCDVWLADFKFGNDICAERLARCPNYLAVVRENLQWASIESELVIRHLLMPGHLDCCWHPIVAWLAMNIPEARVSLNGGFWPGWRSRVHPELARTPSNPELELARELASDYSLNLI
jgi:putative pyruvate formate lyase activating enzyme